MQTACVRCGRIIDGHTAICDECLSETPANDRPYDSAAWRRLSARFTRGKFCVLCKEHGLRVPATIADHWPDTRRELLARGIENPDDEKYLRPLCKTHHARSGRRSRIRWNNDPA
jgi:hypothetical protein